MLIDRYYSENDGVISFTQEQGSEFAKRVAGDFNPLHDAGSNRFCVPGDLLFSVVLARYGISQQMDFNFSGMVVAGVELQLPSPGPLLTLRDADGRDYLEVKRGGDITRQEDLIQSLTLNYVAFSGHTFPDILVPLMAEHKVMIHPTRPMVMYQSMSLDLDTLEMTSPKLESDHNELVVDGRRGAAKLLFNLLDDGEVVGRGCKRMVLSGLREYDEAAVAGAVEEFNQRKAAYPEGNPSAQ